MFYCYHDSSSTTIRFKISVLTLTYVSYVCYHMTRKPIAVVKSVLHRNCSDLPRPSDLDVHGNDDNWCDYAPFGECDVDEKSEK
jgi:MFS transporter, OPA family, solute carrier family 37 (glycerol-3-phosphate transporter), member 1/2